VKITSHLEQIDVAKEMEELVINYVKRYPISSLFFVLNTILFLTTLFLGGFTKENLYELGSFEREAVRNGEIYRFITSIFLHGNLLHYAVNMAALLAFANNLEEWIGKLKYFIFYITCGVLSSVPDLFFATKQSLGASGALYGVLGFYLYIALVKKQLLEQDTRKTIIHLTILNILLSFLVPAINVFAHLGGLVSGFLLAFITNKK
jgi:rhomboid protease GluP